MNILKVLVQVAQVSSELVEEVADMVGDAASRSNIEHNLNRYNAAREVIQKHDEFNERDVNAEITRRVFTHAVLAAATTHPPHSTYYRVTDAASVSIAPVIGHGLYGVALGTKKVIASLKNSWELVTFVDDADSDYVWVEAKKTTSTDEALERLRAKYTPDVATELSKMRGMLLDLHGEVRKLASASAAEKAALNDVLREMGDEIDRTDEEFTSNIEFDRTRAASGYMAQAKAKDYSKMVQK